jgi:hypothetical protein
LNISRLLSAHPAGNFSKVSCFSYAIFQKGCEPQMSYSSYDHDDLELASTMRIERRIYFESGKADLSEMVKLPLAELLSLRAESAAAEQEVFDRLKEQAAMGGTGRKNPVSGQSP